MGTDLTVVNTARVSFDRESDPVYDEEGNLVLDLSDSRLINYLVRHKHDSCLRHCVITFEVYAPLMVARQWWKHTVASSHLDDQEGWNESSRRYITENVEFYIPDQFLLAPDNKKQGSGEPLDEEINASFRGMLMREQLAALENYNLAIEAGIAPEQARLFLPAYGVYVRWRWTGSLNAVMNFLSLRLDGHAQTEIREYAAGIDKFVNNLYPVTYEAWKQHRQG